MSALPFPSPPDLSELLRFFGSPIDSSTVGTSQQQQQQQQRPHYGHQHGACEQRGVHRSASRRTTQRRQPGTNHADAARTVAMLEKAPSSQHQRRRESPPKDPTSRTHDWNGSTQIPATIAKPLKHQILNRNYQPPAPVVVDASGATNLLQRLSKTTVSSRLKRHPADESAALAAATAVLADAFEQRTRGYVPHQRGVEQFPDEQRSDNDDGDACCDTLRVVSDSRARDAIQMLLMYRKEVERRLSSDPTHFPSQ